MRVRREFDTVLTRFRHGLNEVSTRFRHHFDLAAGSYFNFSGPAADHLDYDAWASRTSKAHAIPSAGTAPTASLALGPDESPGELLRRRGGRPLAAAVEVVVG
ncbi:hypothetical protein AXF42_Ash004843 [Apostasia shenzhenica]|uniref:Uncharacterized protein n=1 Tax=Apostasia shenzhenica TaxID=1088818 RepID=A0A2I0B7R3_9ASPA|nr:hypothetical protein AXF42_Ash004843 [Apostasia shenzhenica]